MPAGQSPPRLARLCATDCGGAEVAGEILSERCQCHSATRQAPRSPSLITGNGPIPAPPFDHTSVLPQHSLHRRKRLASAHLCSSLMTNIDCTCDTTRSLALYCMVTELCSLCGGARRKPPAYLALISPRRRALRVRACMGTPSHERSLSPVASGVRPSATLPLRLLHAANADATSCPSMFGSLRCRTEMLGFSVL